MLFLLRMLKKNRAIWSGAAQNGIFWALDPDTDAKLSGPNLWTCWYTLCWWGSATDNKFVQSLAQIPELQATAIR